MYQSSSNSSSSSQGSMSTGATTTGGGHIRYSAPGSLAPAPFFPSEPSHNDNGSRREDQHHTTIGLQPPYARFPPGGATNSSVGFLEQLATTPAPHHDSGFSITRGIVGSYNNSHEGGGGIVSRLNSQLSFNQQETPNSSRDHQTTSDHHHQNAAATDHGFGRTDNHHHAQRKSSSHTNTGFAMGWDNSNQTMFTVGSSKQPDRLDSMESQFQFGMPESALEAATMDKLLQVPQDSVACKLRAKRGCATHPRSIAERERRTRISGKLKKLQDLVPNMDKQTSYADMLDLAVQHINGLQHQVQKLNEELKNCTCGCKPSTPENT